MNLIYGREINQLSRRLATNSIPLLTGIPFFRLLLGERETSLSWWLEEVQRRTYPNLSRFAIDILSIPAKPERVFSGCRRTITWQRIWCKGCGGRRVFEIMDKI